jgi:hypothetical protein
MPVDDALSLLGDLGITLPTPAYLMGVLLFSVIGMVLFWKGRKRKQPPIKWIGLALMLYPYIIWQVLPLYIIGVGLCVAAYYYWR